MQAELTAQTSAERGLDLASWLTVERAAYAGTTALALGLRLWGLARLPLLPAEVSQSLPAWQAATGQAYEVSGASPLLFTLQHFTFIAFGGGDGVARWWPALLGGLAVLCFYALRAHLGRGAALAAAVLWAVSPLAVFSGRLALGYGLVPPLALALLACLSRYLASEAPAVEANAAWGGGAVIDATVTADPEAAAPVSHDRRWLVAAAVSLGLLLCAGPGAYTVILIGLVAALIWREPAGEIWAGVVAHKKPVLLAALLTLALAATGFLTQPSGLALAADVLGRWARGFSTPGEGYSAWSFLRRLLISEPLLLGLAVAGLIASARRGARFATLAGLGTALALLLPLFSAGRHPADLGLVAAGLALLAGPALAWCLEAAASWRRDVDPWLLLVLSLVLAVAASISLPSFFRSTQLDFRNMYLAVFLTTSVLCVGLWLVFGFWGDRALLLRTLPAFALVVGGVWSAAQLAGINYVADPGRPAAILNEAPGSGWQYLQSELRRQALHGSGANEIPIDLVIPNAADPLGLMLHWELKSDPQLRVLRQNSATPAPVVITPADRQYAPGSQYSGTAFTLIEQWQPDGLPGLSYWLRWLLYREAATAQQHVQAIMWVAPPGQPATFAQP